MKWFNNRNTQKQQKTLSTSDQRWNRFINEICFKEQSELTKVQKAAVLSFWYYTEMCSGGHAGYFDCYPNVSHDELAWALCFIGGELFVSNLKEAIENGSNDGYVITDNSFYDQEPSLSDILMKYVESNKDEIFC